MPGTILFPGQATTRPTLYKPLALVPTPLPPCHDAAPLSLDRGASSDPRRGGGRVYLAGRIRKAVLEVLAVDSDDRRWASALHEKASTPYASGDPRVLGLQFRGRDFQIVRREPMRALSCAPQNTL